MKEKRLYIVNVEDIPENESFYDWSDEMVVKTAKEKGQVLTVEEFVSRWNDAFAPNHYTTYMRYLDRDKQLIGYLPYCNGVPLPFDNQVFKTMVDVKEYLEWRDYRMCTIKGVYDDEFTNPNVVTFDDYVFDVAVHTLKDRGLPPTNYEDVLLFLRDNGIPKMRGHEIAERILKHFEK